ncbi:MAG: response regulator [Chloroflexi bacterium]|nr:response regulator [Chloroflexota bacterium]
MAKVLVVDDEPGIRQFVTSALEDEGFDVASAANGQLAVEAALVERPDLVVLDLMLPRLDGEGVAQEIRRLHGHIPFLLMTADVRGQEKAERMGAFAFLSKPFDVGELLTLVQQGLRT